ncbi:MAG: hypothetical protein RBS39_14070, partial [Phycisphaerales bacterium]|nr:hypothetical protein [Phycisphaerales bacterium]
MPVVETENPAQSTARPTPPAPAESPRATGDPRLLPAWAAWMGVAGGIGAAGSAGLIAFKVLEQANVLYVSAGFAVLGGLSGLMGVLVGLRMLRSWPAFGLVTAGGTSALCAAFLVLSTNQGRVGNERVLNWLAVLAVFGLVCAAGGGLAIVSRSRAAVVSLAKGLAACALLAAIGAGAFVLMRGGTPTWMTGSVKAVAIVLGVLASVGLIGLVSYAGHALIRAFEMGTDAA